MALGAHRESGLRRVGFAMDLDARLGTADVVLTGEGRFDETSLRGKVVGELLRLAAEAGNRAVVIAGDIDRVAVEQARRRAGGVVVRGLVEQAGSRADAMTRAAWWLEATAADVAAAWDDESWRHGSDRSGNHS